MSLFDEFVAEFKPKLNAPKTRPGQFDRWPAFEYIACHLLQDNMPLHIVETGTLRSTQDWMGYGQATLQFDWMLQKLGGVGISVDIDAQACINARVGLKKMAVYHDDSITFLRGFKDAAEIELLYLDSYNWSPELHLLSCLHHMGELAAIWDRLSPGCLIAVDDCHSETQGKHVMVRDFFRNMLGKEPEVACHTMVWVK